MTEHSLKVQFLASSIRQSENAEYVEQLFGGHGPHKRAGQSIATVIITSGVKRLGSPAKRSQIVQEVIS